jgi:hypothetical protein
MKKKNLLLTVMVCLNAFGIPSTKAYAAEESVTTPVSAKLLEHWHNWQMDGLDASRRALNQHVQILQQQGRPIPKLCALATQMPVLANHSFRQWLFLLSWAGFWLALLKLSRRWIIGLALTVLLASLEMLPAWTLHFCAVVESTDVAMRIGREADTPRLEMLHEGDIVYIDDRKNTPWRICLGKGSCGFISPEALQPFVL